MAYVPDGAYVSVQLMDNGGNVRTRRWKSDTDAATLEAAFLDNFISSLDEITLATIVSYSIETVWVNDALSLPGEGVHIENLAVLNVNILNNPLKTGLITIPAPSAGIFLGTSGERGDTVDIADAALVTFMTNFQSGNGFYLSDGEYADSPPLSSGRRVHRRSGRRRSVRQG